jgi:hypothetical protein
MIRDQTGSFNEGKNYVISGIVEACKYAPIQSLTGPVGQLFASHLGGQQFASQGCTYSHNGTKFLLLP